MTHNFDDCDDCKKLIEKYGEENLNYCEFCDHYYHGNYCSCGRGQEAEEREKHKREIVSFT